jgi:hypothetical protein
MMVERPIDGDNRSAFVPRQMILATRLLPGPEFFFTSVLACTPGLPTKRSDHVEEFAVPEGGGTAALTVSPTKPVKDFWTGLPVCALFFNNLNCRFVCQGSIER